MAGTPCLELCSKNLYESLSLLFQLSDYLPKPYPNEEAARAANGGLEIKLNLMSHCIIIKEMQKFR